MGPETDTVEPVLAGWVLGVCLAGMFVRKICLSIAIAIASMSATYLI